MALDRPQQAGALPLAVVAALIVWSLDLAGALTAADGLAYDACLARAPAPLAPPAVLLVEWRPGTSPASYAPAVQALNALGARRVAFTSAPDDAPAAFLDEAARLGVVFGTPLGSAALPPLAHGVARRQRTTATLDGTAHPLFEADLARRLGAAPPASDYGVRFRGG
ncbi:MAG: hypothetical protein ACRC33_08445, partial [Gemmataceae bacterium]